MEDLEELTHSQLRDKYGDLVEEGLRAFESDPSYVVEMIQTASRSPKRLQAIGVEPHGPTPGRKRTPPLTPQQVSQARERYANGEQKTRICQSMKITRARLDKALRDG